jgi:hypothetical protein
MNRYTVIRKGAAVSFDSPYTTVAAIERCRALSANSFAASLVSQWDDRGLSDNQIAWVHRLAVDADAPAAVPAAQVGLPDLSRIVTLFAAASVNYPRVTFDIPERNAFIVLSLCGEKSRTPGAVNVTNGEAFGSVENRFFGRVNRDGTFTPGRDATPLVGKVLSEMANDPAGFAARYGKKSGRCCFCNAELTDERSTTVGYGKICAAHWGLPWGEREPVATAPTSRRPRRKSLPDPVVTLPAEVVNVRTPAALAAFERLVGTASKPAPSVENGGLMRYHHAGGYGEGDWSE